jgi:hypothetical protein
MSLRMLTNLRLTTAHRDPPAKICRPTYARECLNDAEREEAFTQYPPQIVRQEILPA